MLVLQDQEWLQIRVVDEQPSCRSKKNDDKSAVAMLKKNDWHENVRQPVVNRDLLDVDHRVHDIWVLSFKT